MTAEVHVQEKFEERLVGIYNNAALTLMIALGHRSGLFDVMAKLQPSTSPEIAAAAKLNERYVREWLNALTSGGVIEYDPNSKRYVLPEHRARWLIRESTKDNFAAFSQYISILAGVEDDVLHCFKHGGGVPYAKFGRFHEVMAEDSGQSLVPALIENVFPLVPGLPEMLSTGIDVLDVGCGRGLALMRAAREFPKSRFVGYDFSKEAIEYATSEAKLRGLRNLRFEERDVSSFDEEGEFDLITAFDAIHDQAKPFIVLENICRSLKPDGVFIMQDIDASSHVDKNLNHPLGPFLYTVSCMHCMTVSLALDGDGLGTMWGREVAEDYLRKSGFANVEIHKLHHDIQNCIYIATK